MILHFEIQNDWMGLVVSSCFKLQNYEFKTSSYNISEPYYQLNPNTKITASKFDEIHSEILKIIRNAEHLIKNSRRFLDTKEFQLPTGAIESTPADPGKDGDNELSTERDDTTYSYIPASDLVLAQKYIALKSTNELDLEALFATQIKNKKKITTKIIFKKTEYIIPPNCSFMISDFNLLKDYLIKLDMRFDLIVMDPPWENKSVKRSGKYECLDHYELFKIPVNRVLAQRGYFCIWVTNSAKLHNFVLNVYAKDLGLVRVSTIVWVKVTTKGEYVIPIHSTHRKTYEVCYVFRKISDSSPQVHPTNTVGPQVHPTNTVVPQVHPTNTVGSKVHSINSNNSSSFIIPSEICLVSVPSKEHSRKPNLQGMND
jgi:N6-adenosine-specific RNA methylase IME4